MPSFGKFSKLSLRYVMAKLLLRGVSRSTMNLWWKTLKEESLIVSRFVYDTVKSSAVHFSEIRLNRRLKRNVRAVRMRYQLHLEDQRKLTVESEKARKRKAVQDEIRAVESKRKLLKESISSMIQEADALAVQADKSTVSFCWLRPTLLDKKCMKVKQMSKVFSNKHAL